MGNVNRVILLGAIGSEPELRYTPSGKAVLETRMATNHKWKGDNGQWNESVEWHTVVAWGRAGEVIKEYCKKGSQLYIEGRLQTRSWEDKKGGGKRYRTEIIVEQFQFLGGRRDGEQAAPREQAKVTEPDWVSEGTEAAPDPESEPDF